MFDLSDLFSQVVEYAPSVAILLYLNWRSERRLARVLDWCLGELSDNDPEKDE